MNSRPLVFVETTAVVQNALARREVRDGIHQATQDEALLSSMFVLSEFRAVLDGLYGVLRRRLLAIADLDRSDSIREIVRLALDGVPPTMPGGYPTIADLAIAVALHFGDRAVTARQVANWLEGERVAVERSGLRFPAGYLDEVSDLIDNSTCCAFHESTCGETPQEHCHLRWVCGAGRAEFFAAVSHLAGSAREEGQWLRKNLDRLSGASGTLLLRRVTEHVGHFADIIIFFGIPDGARVLTRDQTFRLLAQRLSRAITIVHVRARRRPIDVEAVVTGAGQNATQHVVRMRNWTSRDCSFVSATRVGKKRDPVTVSSNELRIGHKARIMREDHVEDGFEYGVRFTEAVDLY